MRTAYELIECQHKKKPLQLPYFTNEAWLFIFLSLGFFSGMIGVILYQSILSPFLK